MKVAFARLLLGLLALAACVSAASLRATAAREGQTLTAGRKALSLAQAQQMVAGGAPVDQLLEVLDNLQTQIEADMQAATAAHHKADAACQTSVKELGDKADGAQTQVEQLSSDLAEKNGEIASRGAAMKQLKAQSAEQGALVRVKAAALSEGAKTREAEKGAAADASAALQHVLDEVDSMRVKFSASVLASRDSSGRLAALMDRLHSRMLHRLNETESAELAAAADWSSLSQLLSEQKTAAAASQAGFDAELATASGEQSTALSRKTALEQELSAQTSLRESTRKQESAQEATCEAAASAARSQHEHFIAELKTVEQLRHHVNSRLGAMLDAKEHLRVALDDDDDDGDGDSADSDDDTGDGSSDDDDIPSVAPADGQE